MRTVCSKLDSDLTRVLFKPLHICKTQELPFTLQSTRRRHGAGFVVGHLVTWTLCLSSVWATDGHQLMDKYLSSESRGRLFSRLSQLWWITQIVGRVNAVMSSWCIRQTRWNQRKLLLLIYCITPSPGGRQTAYPLLMLKGLSVELTWSCCPTWL